MRLVAGLLIVGACGGSSPSPASPVDHAMHGDHAHHAHHAHQGGMHKRFDRADDWVAVFDDPARDAWQHPDEVVGLLALTDAMAVADVGAGTGYFTVRLARAVPRGHVFATDLESDMVRYLAERATREQLTNVTAVQATADDASLAADSVDRILVVDVWHHVADRARYASSLARALRPGGKVAIVDFTMEATHGPPVKHRLAPDVIVGDLKAAGLDATVVTETLPDQFVVIGTRR